MLNIDALPRLQAASARLVTRMDADYFHSATHVIMAFSTVTFLAAGRFGLAPTANRWVPRFSTA